MHFWPIHFFGWSTPLRLKTPDHMTRGVQWSIGHVTERLRVRLHRSSASSQEYGVNVGMPLHHQNLRNLGSLANAHPRTAPT